MTGTATLSIEIELGWGPARLPGSNTGAKLSEGRRRETETLQRFLDACDRNEVAVSFDVVGHLLLESCDGDHDCPIPGHFDVCPETDVETDPLYYAPDLVEAIRSADVDHEICTHTFSHIDCHAASQRTIEWELRAARRAHEEFGLEPPTSFVPPLHHMPPLDTLTNTGIRTVRAPLPEYDPPDRPLLRHGWSLTKEYPTRDPRYVDGIVHTYVPPHPALSSQHLSTGQLPPSPVFRALPLQARQRLHERYLAGGLDRAVEQDGFVHYWTHLFNMSNDAQWQPIAAFLDRLGEYQRRKAVAVETMDALPRHVG